nr:hypothetical protein [uncultured Cellulosilyticum sp.]
MIDNVTYAIIRSNDLSLVSKNVSKENDFKYKFQEKVNPVEPIGRIRSFDKRNAKADAYVAYNILKYKMYR